MLFPTWEIGGGKTEADLSTVSQSVPVIDEKVF